MPLTKWAQRYLPWIERNEFFKKSVTEFPTLRHLSSRCDILATLTPNWTRLESMETRHPYLSRDINFEEIRAQKDLQTMARILDLKLGKIRNRKT